MTATNIKQETKEQKETRIFNHYSKRLKERGGMNGRIRFNVIQYVCSFPGLDPVEMAACLQRDGFTILYDDSSISARENAAHRRQVEKVAAALA